MRTKQLTVVVAFTSLALASDFALTDAWNVKLVDPIVFSVAFVFGLETGIFVGVLSELAWGAVSPYGFGGYIIPFLVAGEVLFALAGWAASKVWQAEGRRLSARNLYFGACLALCAFVWDVETNLGTAIIEYWPRLTAENLARTEALGLPFMLPHELSDLATGALLAPTLIFYAARSFRPRPRKTEG